MRAWRALSLPWVVCREGPVGRAKRSPPERRSTETETEPRFASASMNRRMMDTCPLGRELLRSPYPGRRCVAAPLRSALGYSQPPLRGFPALTYSLFPTVFTDPCRYATQVPAIRQEKAKRFAERTATIGSETAMNFRPSYETSIEGYESGSYSLTKLR